MRRPIAWSSPMPGPTGSGATPGATRTSCRRRCASQSATPRPNAACGLDCGDRACQRAGRMRERQIGARLHLSAERDEGRSSLAAHSSAGLVAPARRSSARARRGWIRPGRGAVDSGRAGDARRNLCGLRGQRGRRHGGRPRPAAGRSLDVGRGRIDRLLSRRGRTGDAAEQRHVHVPTGGRASRSRSCRRPRASTSTPRPRRCSPACSGGLARRRTMPSITPTGSRARASVRRGDREQGQGNRRLSRGRARL